MRYTIFSFLNSDSKKSIARYYNAFLMATIFLSLLPLATKQHTELFLLIDYLTTAVFCIDYLLRLLTADYLLQRGKLSFFYYPFQFLAIMDLLSILPTFLLLNNSLKLLKMVRMWRLLKVLRIVRHSKNIRILANVLSKQRDSLLLVCMLAIGYIFLSALLLFNIEPNTFPHFFDALYWATISLTTVGYGNIFAVSTLGKTLTMISSLIGIAIVALPAGIITAGYLEEIHEQHDSSS